MMFSVEERERVGRWLVEFAQADRRVVAGAVIGAGALEPPGRWSDIDLTFGVREGVSTTDVLADWTRELADAHGAVYLFDLPYLSTVYRVFLFPGNLQVDLSFTPGAEFGPLGPRFRLLFGATVERDDPPPVSPRYVVGLAVHHAVRARSCIERERYWQAEYWISALRDHALELACVQRGLDVEHGRGFDRLPADVLRLAGGALVRSVDRTELLRALAIAIRMLIVGAKADTGSRDVLELIVGLESQLLELLEPFER
jgi:hypothetical protein